MSKRQSFLPASAPTESLTFTTTTTILYCSFMELIADRCNPLRPAGDSVPETLTTSRLKLFFFIPFKVRAAVNGIRHLTVKDEILSRGTGTKKGGYSFK